MQYMDGGGRKERIIKTPKGTSRWNHVVREFELGIENREL